MHKMQVLSLFVFLVMPFYVLNVVGSSIGEEDKSLTSAELQSINDRNVIIAYAKKERNKRRDEQRVSQILGFICASGLIRGINSAEYKQAEKLSPNQMCETTWATYINRSSQTAARNLRGEIDGNVLVDSTEYRACGTSLCSTFRKCRRHVHNDNDTVKVLSFLKRGTSETLLEILQREKPRYLIEMEEMKYLNLYVKATGEDMFPFLVLEKGGNRYAVPQIRSSRDTENCAAIFCF